MAVNHSQRWISEIKQIPSLPKEVHHLIQTLTNDAIEFRQLTKIIEAHPTIAARLIALANSAWAAPVMPITTLENACVRLGFSIVRSVSIGLAVISPFNASKCPGFDIQRYWVSSMLVADGAALLAAGMPQSGQLEQTVRTAGILHNFGLLCLAHKMPWETQQALSCVAEDSELNLSSVLQQTIHTDYCEVGALIIETLGIPRHLVLAIRHHRDFSYQGPYWELCRLVGYSAMIASALCKNQEILPHLEAITEIPLSDDFKQGVFNRLQERMEKTSEFARLIFNQ
ncbi:MAG: HDOD domain-containing protein [Gammaproteobacteria bacterium]